MTRPRHPNSQILLFPKNGDPAEVEHAESEGQPPGDVVLSGSFRKDLPGLRQDFDELRDLGFRILSPHNTNAVSEEDGFVFMQGEEAATPEAIEWRHLDAIRRSSFVWLHAPEGYVGPSAALEVGFARACGIPVYSRSAPNELVLQQMVRIVTSPRDLLAGLSRHPEPPLPAVQPFQSYYARAAIRRGYEKETAQDTLLLMLEEFGELARAVRKRQKLRRDGKKVGSNEQQELADVFIYVIHMANVLGFDLADAVQRKEQLNIEKFLER